jgi:hypothetical protein
MSVSEHLRFSVRGFSAKRVGYVLDALSFSLVPIHFRVPCEISGLLSGFGIILFFSTAVLTILVPRGTPKKFRPLGVAFVALLFNLLSTH